MDDMMKFGECLSDTLGIRILALLRHGELCVCEVKGVLGEERSKVDLRLRKLQQSGVVKTRKRGRWLAFRIHTKYTDLVETVFEAWEDDTVWDPALTQDQERLKAELRKRIEDWCANPRSSKARDEEDVIDFGFEDSCEAT